MSFLQKRESSYINYLWIPAIAGMTDFDVTVPLLRRNAMEKLASVNNASCNLPTNYFDDKNALTYRFHILEDIVRAGNNKPVQYDDSHEQYINNIYKNYENVTLYIDLPWCEVRCNYCYYYKGKVEDEKKMQNLIQTEQQHAKLLDDKIHLKSKNVRSIYFGGGTPTILTENLLEDCLSFYVNRYGNNDCEVCCEASLYTLTPKKLDILEKYVNRLSVGIQSFNNNLLKVVERSFEGIRLGDLIKEIIPRFASVNIDLMYGLQTQTLDDWVGSIQTAIDLKVPSVTTYHLDIRESDPISEIFRRKPDLFPDESMCQTMYLKAKTMFKKAGYRENLIGWFLLPKVSDTTVYRERWEKQTPCIAFGPNVHNYGADHFYDTLADREAYTKAVQSGSLPIEHFYKINDKKKVIWYVLAQWKSNKPVYKEVLSVRFGTELFNWFVSLIQDHISWNVLKEYSDTIEVTEQGTAMLEWILSDYIDNGLA